MIDSETDKGTEAAYLQALKSFNEGGGPVGSSIFIEGAVVAVGHNKRFQQKSNILHGEMDCIENAGHAYDLSKATLFTTLSPCQMCANAILLFRIPRVVILDNTSTTDFTTNVDSLMSEGVDVVISDRLACTHHRIPFSICLDQERAFKRDRFFTGQD
jgi:cytosine deaminase|tara:strand:- start:28063 stop:28536 length:474 start_codon:yes stop_codon:yes gene_type:complete